MNNEMILTFQNLLLNVCRVFCDRPYIGTSVFGVLRELKEVLMFRCFMAFKILFVLNRMIEFVLLVRLRIKLEEGIMVCRRWLTHE